MRKYQIRESFWWWILALFQQSSLILKTTGMVEMPGPRVADSPAPRRCRDRRSGWSMGRPRRRTMAPVSRQLACRRQVPALHDGMSGGGAARVTSVSAHSLHSPSYGAKSRLRRSCRVAHGARRPEPMHHQMHDSRQQRLSPRVEVSILCSRSHRIRMRHGSNAGGGGVPPGCERQRRATARGIQC